MFPQPDFKTVPIHFRVPGLCMGKGAETHWHSFEFWLERALRPKLGLTLRAWVHASTACRT